MLTRHVALISQTQSVSFAALTEAAAAIQKQVTRDFGPIWGVDATVDAFEKLEDAPIDYWHVLIRDDIDRPDVTGFHTTQLNQPIAFVQFDDDWTITTSHETLEMLADPSGNAMVAGDSVKAGQGRVQYIQEVCDPCQGSIYQVNTVNVSDFYTPNYFDPVQAAGVRYSFNGTITGPRQVIKGGYLTFIEPVSGHVFQLRWFDTTKPVVVNLSANQSDVTAMLKPGMTLREMVDCATPRMPIRPKRSAALKAKLRRAESTRTAHALALQHCIDRLLNPEA